MCRCYQAGRHTAEKGRQVSRAPLPNSGVISVGETCAISWEGITPPSSLVLAHSPLPLGSLLLRHLASFGESLQVVTSPCCPRQLLPLDFGLVGCSFPDAVLLGAAVLLSPVLGVPVGSLQRPCLRLDLGRSREF
jgi:hypothetical protein